MTEHPRRDRIWIMFSQWLYIKTTQNTCLSWQEDYVARFKCNKPGQVEKHYVGVCHTATFFVKRFSEHKLVYIKKITSLYFYLFIGDDRIENNKLCRNTSK